MADRFPGGIISKTPPAVSGPAPGTGGAASGVWTLDEMLGYVQAGIWPGAALPSPNLYAWGPSSPTRILSGIAAPSSPVQVGFAADWASVDGDNTGNHFLLLTSSGTLWASGINNDGQLGTNDRTSISAPAPIGALTDWSVISAGTISSAAIRTNGTMWSWGYNGYGRLGQNDTVSRSSPTQVGALTTWAQVSISVVMIAVKTDGTIWSCGPNNQGTLGQGDEVARSSPTQIGALTNWAYPSSGGGSAGAVKTDGTAWAWGANNVHGQLGIGTTQVKSSPTQIGALTSWSRVYMGDENSMFLRTDYNLFTAGKNDRGQLGINTQNNYNGASSPVQVGAAVWASARRPRQTMHAIRTDGTLWGWGQNGGSVGDNDTPHRSSPVQVGSDTNWLIVTSANDAPAGIQSEG
jgi:alpha-tubulin suppressor-like RCC1 family protein